MTGYTYDLRQRTRVNKSRASEKNPNEEISNACPVSSPISRVLSGCFMVSGAHLQPTQPWPGPSLCPALLQELFVGSMDTRAEAGTARKEY